ncbi:MAG: hypothetical protein EOP20_04340, partial [Hyphomicrobiales bacterium]
MQMTANPESDFDRMLRLCREAGLPDVSVGTSYGVPALRARDKAFATLKQDKCMVLNCGHEQKAFPLEMAPETYWVTEHFKYWPGLMVRLDVISDHELKGRLVQAWKQRMTKKAAALYDAR